MSNSLVPAPLSPKRSLRSNEAPLPMLKARERKLPRKVSSFASLTPPSTADRSKKSISLSVHGGDQRDLDSKDGTATNGQLVDKDSTRSCSLDAQARNSVRLRKSISIAHFPQPPHSRLSLNSSTSASPRTSADFVNSPATDSAQSMSVRNDRLRKLRNQASSSSLNKRYNAQTPAQISMNATRCITASSSCRRSSGLASMPSPTHSRSSSARDSQSTAATTCDEMTEDAEDETTSSSAARSRNEEDGANQGNVTVSVRVRPDTSQDKSPLRDWLVDSRQSLISYQGGESGEYVYDNVFASYDQNHRVYDACAKRLVRRVMEGYHGTVFAYGMTGTGKTFSMQGTKTSPGVIPLAITDIFSYIRETPQREFLLRVSYLEIYNEKMHDLLAPAPTTNAAQEEIKLREDSKRGVYATPLKEEIVQSPTQLLRVIARGDQYRRTRSTQHNTQSSRSHAIVQIVVESRDRGPIGGSTEKRAGLLPGGVRVSTLSLIDLAGSERAAEDKDRRQEGAYINKSLLTLGTVVSRLSGFKDANGKPIDRSGQHLPYRDSKLTRLLQPALSGDSLVSILCTVRLERVHDSLTSKGHTGETLNTLKFASRAKNNIVSHAKRAEEALGEAGDGGSRVLLERYRMEIQDLRHQLDTQKKDQLRQEVEEDRRLSAASEHNDNVRHEQQVLEIHLARTALQRRMDDLKRLILSSQSSGVNSRNGHMSSGSLYSSRASVSSRHEERLSGSALSMLRSIPSQSTIGRHSPVSRVSSAPSGRESYFRDYIARPDPEEVTEMGISDDEELFDQFDTDAHASSKAHISALHDDLADRNRYIATLEQRLLQVRRTSQPRSSQLGSPSHRASHSITPPHPSRRESWSQQALAEKDAQILELQARLEDKDRMLVALKSAMRNRDFVHNAPPSPVSPDHVALAAGLNVHPYNQSPTTSPSMGLESQLLDTPTRAPFSCHGDISILPAKSARVFLVPEEEEEEEEEEPTFIPKGRSSLDDVSQVVDSMIHQGLKHPTHS